VHLQKAMVPPKLVFTLRIKCQSEPDDGIGLVFLQEPW